MITLRTRLTRFFWLLLPGSLLGLALPWLNRPLLFESGTLPWLLDLAVHWQWLFLTGLLLAATIGSWLNRRWFLLLLVTPLPWLSAAPELPAGHADRPLKIVSANVHLDNHDATALIDWLDVAQPELVVLLEVSPGFAQSLQRLNGYPYRVLHPQHSPFGIALLSRLPLLSSSVVTDNQGIAHIDADLTFAGCTIAMSAFHPMPPLSPAFQAQRDSQLRSLVLRKQNRTIPALVAGDLNMTPWAAAFSWLDTLGWRRASGLHASWGSALGIPIDHVLASPHWRAVSYKHGPELGSDHRALLVELSLAEQPCTRTIR